MASDPTELSLDRLIIDRVVLVDRVTRENAGEFHSSSLPGHLVHYTVEGEVEEEMSGSRTVRLGAGDVVWYHQDQSVRGRILRTPWTFYTLNFWAARMPPPPDSARVWKGDADVQRHFSKLFDAWNDLSVPPLKRHLRIMADVATLLLHVIHDEQQSTRGDAATELWWRIENAVRTDLSRPIDMNMLEHLAGCSANTINRSCRRAVGTAPMKRVKDIRMSYARGLVYYSELPMTDIAFRIGYSRVQEFSRDYHRRFGVTPTADRKNRPTAL